MWSKFSIAVIGVITTVRDIMRRAIIALGIMFRRAVIMRHGVTTRPRVITPRAVITEPDLCRFKQSPALVPGFGISGLRRRIPGCL